MKQTTTKRCRFCKKPVFEARPEMMLAKPLGDVSVRENGRKPASIIRDTISKQLRFRLRGMSKDGAVYDFVEEY